MVTATRPSWPSGDTFAGTDPALGNLLDQLLGPDERTLLQPVLRELDDAASGRLSELATTADANPPRLRQYDANGERVDEIVFHPAYTELANYAFERLGLAAMSHRAGIHYWPATAPHIAKYALSYVFVQAEFGICCPVSMTDSAARVLRLFGDPSVFGDYLAGLTATEHDSLLTGAMFMTERAGGTDVGQTETTARRKGDDWVLHGRKWFASNASADVILTLARVPGGADGTAGLGLFLVPRTRPDGSRNSYRIDRLKDKLGTRSMASGEVTLDGAYALPVGDLSRGFRQMAEMVNVSRLSNVLRSAGLMRRAVWESVWHTKQRVVFGKPLFDQPLMRASLLPLQLHAESALGFALECAKLLDEADRGDELAGRLIRVLTPLGKYTICKQARWVTGEAMEIRGGNGYIEDWVNPRLVRDAHLGSIWEGSSNVIALDALRCMRKSGAHDELTEHLTDRLAKITDPEVTRAAQRVLDRLARLRARGNELLAAPDDWAQAAAGRYTGELSRATQAAFLVQQAAREADAGGGYRKLLVANCYLGYLDGAEAPPAALDCLEQIVFGGTVDASTANTPVGQDPGS
ncbi:alkylation response protein AidB-like acyl-CoA dehydrogenase [Tamaricihabitans halophyticus]|uniref:Alkylation response protein AidB-like acyl-CoA dehydrogenase n=1 Tax=Tamaricihabitans halophyticus TaxID=1262583 RepID=A0A4R2R410_9PSEU|nr:acyl-CoA dehydrogenase family protein [Tamaricihabitans halophyticus]TCP56757.1 alkylation response protein AidB-like acyl-CoA dehydrogenase [Tamaricihabitans halophyticus]